MTQKQLDRKSAPRKKEKRASANSCQSNHEQNEFQESQADFQGENALQDANHADENAFPKKRAKGKTASATKSTKARKSSNSRRKKDYGLNEIFLPSDASSNEVSTPKKRAKRKTTSGTKKTRAAALNDFLSDIESQETTRFKRKKAPQMPIEIEDDEPFATAVAKDAAKNVVKKIAKDFISNVISGLFSED